MRFYADASGKDSDLVRVAGGYFATDKQWSAFEREWHLALNEAQVTCFHATDFYGSWGEFAGWDATKQSKFAKRFTAIAEKQTLVGMATGVEVAPFRSHLGPILGDLKSVPHRRFTPLMLCAINVLSQVSALCGNHRHAVAALFEAEEGMGETIEYFNYLKRKGVPWTQVFASVGVGDKSFLPLQAADLLAHESWRHLKETVRPTGRPMRKSMQRLLKNGGVQIHLLPRDAYDAELLEQVRQYIREDRLV